MPFTSIPIKQNSSPTSSINQFSKVLCINCQSIQSAEKRSRFYALLELHKPDIIVGTESWLHKDILDSEVFPSSLGFNLPIRRNKSTDSKGGEVFILVSRRLVVSEQPKLSTNCEIVWAKVEIVGAKPLLIFAYYRPSEHDQISAVKPNCPHPDMHYDLFPLDDNCLTQMVQEPTRESNILDLFLTLVDSVYVHPGISDHLAVISSVKLRPSIQKLKPRNLHLYSKAD